MCKKYFFTIIAFLLIAILTQNSYSVPASPELIEVTQPDGVTVLKLRNVGDEGNGHLVTEDGYTVLQDSNGWYHYSKLDANNNLALSGVIVNSIENRSNKEVEFLNKTEKNITPKRITLDYDPMNKEDQLNMRSSDAEAVTGNVLVILIKYPDETNTYSQADVQDLMYASNYDGFGSVKDYYNEVSYGNYNLNPTVTRWYTASENRSYYAYDPSNTTRSYIRAAQLVRDAVNAAISDGINFAQFDNSNSGTVDGLMVVHAGPGAEVGDHGYPWSHVWSLASAGILPIPAPGGVFVNTYAMVPEKYYQSSQSNIGVYCHEYGHLLYLPDLYDTDGSSDGIGDWGLMGGGSWNGGGRAPAHMTAWSKYKKGWLNPINVESLDPSDYIIENAEENPICYRMWADGAVTSEYFLIEYRQKILFDSYLSNCGLAIWHIDDTRTSNENDNHRLVDLECMDESTDPNDYSEYGDLWLDGIFNTQSVPNSNAYSGNATDVHVFVHSDICEANGISVDLFVEEPEDYDGDGIYDVVDDCIDSDGDGFGDPGFSSNTCADDNCVDTYNPDQLDCNLNGIGDVCEAIEPCADPSNWTTTFGGAGYDAAKFVEPIYDTTWTNTVTVTSVAAYYDNSPRIVTIPEAQTIDYRFQYGEDFPRTARIKKNGVVMDHIDNIDGLQSGDFVYGSFPVVEGDVILIEVDPYSPVADNKDNSGLLSATVSTSIQFEYETTETTVNEITLNSYIFAGIKTNDNKDFYVAATNECGAVIDSMSVGTTEDDYAEAACLTSTDDIVVVGYTQSATDKSIYVSKFHQSTGFITYEWSNTFNFSADDRAFSVVEAIDGGYLVLGTTFNGTYDDITLLKLSTTGTLLWQQTYSTATDDQAGDIIRSNTGDGYYIVGTTGGPQQINYDVYIIKTDASGNALWTSTLGQPGYYEIANSIIQGNDNHLLIAGQSSEDGYSDMLLMKASGVTGSLIWYHLYGEEGYENAYQVLKNGISGYVLAGRTSLPAPSYWDCYFVMTDVDGNLVLEDTIGGATDDIAFSIKSTLDNGYIMGGYSVGNCQHQIFGAKFITDVPAEPTLVSPIAGELFYDVEPPLLQWDDVSNAESYFIEIDNNSDFSSPRVIDSGITVSEYQAPGVGELDGLKENTYYWRVRGYNSISGYGFWSESGHFDCRYAKPTLTTPSNYATLYSGGSHYFGWEALPEVGSNYQIQIATDYSFNNLVINTSNSYCENGYCGYNTSYPFPDGVYYWRVKSNKPGFYWSNMRRFTMVTILPSCPVLFSYNGTEFVQENPLLTACEQSGYVDVVTDYYQVNSDVAPKDGKITFQLRELENEITYLDNFELITVDHQATSKIACTVDGEIFSYQSSVAPLTAVDQDGNNCIEQIAATDNKMFKSENAGSLILTFPNTGNDVSVAFRAPIKIECPQIDLPGMGKESVEQNEKEEVELHKFTVEQQQVDGSWLELSQVPTRVNAVGEFVMTNVSENNSARTITIRISWDNKFITDEIRQYIPTDETPVINSWTIDQFAVNRVSPVAKTWDGFKTSHTLELRKGDVAEFSFDVREPENQELQRTYIIRSVGKYEPDYSVYTNLIPNQYRLFDNYPNPFNPSTTIGYNLPQRTNVKIEVINMLGQKVATLIDQSQEVGYHEVIWDGKNEHGSEVGSGIYFYRISTNTFSDTKKMMLLK